MVANPPYLRLSPDDYLELEPNATMRSQYEAGVAYMMAGASRAHTLIVGNVNGELRDRLRSRPCESYTNDMKVWIAATNIFYYPDIVAVCGERVFRDEREDVL
jgi:Uma2 family endonuclease